MVPAWLVCPECRGALVTEPLRCSACGRPFETADGILDLIVGRRFEDEPSADRDAIEEEMDDFTVRSYLLPRMRAAQAGRPHRLRVLSLGCGVARDVELINDAGFEGVGVDCGSRVEAWKTRRHRDRLFRASALHLPFADKTFDVVFSGCVLAHIGVVGDSRQMTADYREERAQFCAEAARVTREGGHLILSGPNRWCPVDLFHRDRGYLPRFHAPTERFLASFGDIRALFRQQPGVTAISPLRVDGYWRFNGLNRQRFGRLLATLLTWYFKAVSWGGAPVLRRTMFNPWLIVRIDK